MGNPRTYRLLSGEKVPGVTTVLGKFKDPGGLIHWAWQLGKDGRDYSQVRDEAASAGTLAHQLIEDSIRGTETADAVGLSKETVDASFRAYRGFQEWRDQTGLRLLESEVSLVSEKYRYGGTFDALGNDEGTTVLVDWKTSKKPYASFVAQLGAYANLWSEYHPDRPVHEGWILLFSREDSSFRAFHYNHRQISWGFQMFLMLAGAWWAEKQINEFYDIEAKEERE